MKKMIGSFLASVFLLTGCAGNITVTHINNNRSLIRFTAGKYLLLPVQESVGDARMTVEADGVEIRTFNIKLARTAVDYYVPLDLSGYRGTEIEILSDNCPYDAIGFKKLKLSAKFRADRSERFRPLLHHTPPYGWMNDPNGMVWLDGEYHLFYQHNPFGSKWENMSWGHSVSRDLVTWEHLPVALEPDELGAIFSGSCVIDTDDSAGFGHGAMIAVYTSAGSAQTQSIAYSTDNGRTFTKYEGNPVLTGDIPDFRDPKVFRDPRTGRWVMVLAAGHEMRFYGSADLKQWEYLSSFGRGYGNHEGVWECPDLIFFPADGSGEAGTWVLLCSIGAPDGSRVQYFTGHFDGREFTCDSDPSTVKWMDHGHDHYATVTWSNEPEGKPLAIGWMNNWPYANDVPTLHFRSANTVVRELSLYESDGEVYLASVPCSRLDRYFGPAEGAPRSFTVDPEYNISSLTGRNDGAYRVKFAISTDHAEISGFKLFNEKGEYVDIYFNSDDATVTVDRSHSGKTDFSPSFTGVSTADFRSEGSDRIDMIMDRSSMELFINGGRVVFTEQLFPSQPYNRMNFYCKGGGCKVEDFVVTNLNNK